MAKFLTTLVLALLFFAGVNLLRQHNIQLSLAEFETLCTDGCAATAERSSCAPICSCMLETLRERHGSDEQLVDYLSDLGDRFERMGERGTPELQPIADACAARLLR